MRKKKKRRGRRALRRWLQLPAPTLLSVDFTAGTTHCNLYGEDTVLKPKWLLLQRILPQATVAMFFSLKSEHIHQTVLRSWTRN